MEKKFIQVHNLPELTDRRKILRNRATPQERKLWALLKGKQRGFKFRRQHSIGFYIADFYCPEKRLIIEIDGLIHSEDERVIYDAIRDQELKDQHIKIIRFWNFEIDTDIGNVIKTIDEYINSS